MEEEKCIVYLISFEDGTGYVGSTNNLQSRMKTHRYRSSTEVDKHYYNKLYCKMRECAYGVSVLEECDTDNRFECENKWISDLHPELNSYSAPTGLSEKEYYEKNREKICARGKEYRENNREKLNAQKKEYYEKNKEKILAYHDKYREKNREKLRAKDKEFYQKNKEKILAYHDEYRKKNKEKMYARQKEKINCPQCDKLISRQNMSRHIKTKH